MYRVTQFPLRAPHALLDAATKQIEGVDMKFGRDGKGQTMVEWEIANGAWKRAWIQDRSGTEKDWAGTGRYLNVVRTEGLGAGPGGNATDFPIYNDLPDKQILRAFVESVSALTGHRLGDEIR